jgi:hypothetical protein
MAAGETSLDEVCQCRLEHGRLARQERTDHRWFGVETRYLVSSRGQARSRDRPEMPEAGDADVH